MQVINTTQYFISSENRTSGNISYFSIDTPPNNTKNNTAFRVKVLEVTIPFTFQQLNTDFNTITYSFTRTGYVPFTSSITILPGNYDISSLILALKTSLIADILIYSGITLHSFNFEFNKNTMHVSLGFVNENVLTTIALGSNIRFQNLLGFSSAINFTSTNVSVSTKPVDMATARSLFIRSSLQTRCFENLRTNSKMTGSDILLKVQINSGPGSLIRYQNNYDSFINISDVTIDKLTFYLTDHNGNYIILLLDWGLSILVEEYVIEILQINPRVDNTHQEQLRTREMQKQLEEERISLISEAKNDLNKYIKKI